MEFFNTLATTPSDDRPAKSIILHSLLQPRQHKFYVVFLWMTLYVYWLFIVKYVNEHLPGMSGHRIEHHNVSHQGYRHFPQSCQYNTSGLKRQKIQFRRYQHHTVRHNMDLLTTLLLCDVRQPQQLLHRQLKYFNRCYYIFNLNTSTDAT